MSSRKCCVTHCSGGQPLHSFPNPKTNLELFRIWVLAIEGKIVGLEDDFIYENRRVCRRHFAANYLYAKSKLSKMAVPTLFLTGNTSDIIQPSSTTTNVTCVQPIVPEISSNPPEECGKLSRDAEGTADLLHFFDKLFDSVNEIVVKVYRTAVKPRLPHQKLWCNSLKVLNTMKFVENGKKCSVPSVERIKTIEGFQKIVQHLHSLGMTSLLLCNFTQDSLEDFMGRSEGSWLQ